MTSYYIVAVLILLSHLSSGQTTKTIFNKNQSFEILSLKKDFTTQSSSTDKDICNGWTINKKFIPRIIKKCKFISGTEWDFTFDFLPCIISGELKQNGNIFKYEINAGSWLYIKSADTTMILGNYQKENNKFFISNPY
ncbi:MAG: hypothetical protein ABIP30_14840 [Ferruginibacter sp.]